MAENLSCDWRAMVGPWPHEFPDDCVPGPNVAYLPECLRFWDYHLKGIKNGLDQEPKLRLYLQESRHIMNLYKLSRITIKLSLRSNNKPVILAECIERKF